MYLGKGGGVLFRSRSIWRNTCWDIYERYWKEIDVKSAISTNCAF
jgi:hypothetical protein